MLRVTGFAIATAIPALLIGVHAQGQSADGGFPEAPDRALVEKTCTACHVGAQVTSQRKSADDWAATVDQMIAYGAPISDADYPRIVDYLANNFKPE